MELTDLTRSEMVDAFRNEIERAEVALDPDVVGILRFYDKNELEIVDLELKLPCMTITGGVGTFDDTSPYLRGTVPVGKGGTANRFKFLDNTGTRVVAVGTCGDPSNTGRDIQFNTLDWADYDNITLTWLTVSQPAGANDYIA